MYYAGSYFCDNQIETPVAAAWLKTCDGVNTTLVCPSGVLSFWRNTVTQYNRCV